MADTPEEEAIGAYFRGAWAAFAKDPYNGLTSYGWPQYSANESTLVRLAYDNQTGPNLAVGDEYDSGCQAVASATTTSSTSTATTTTTTSRAVPGNVGGRSSPRIDAISVFLALILCLLR